MERSCQVCWSGGAPRRTTKTTRSARGRLVEHRDQAGTLKTEQCDFKGNLKKQERSLATDFQNLLDWNGSPSLTSPSFIHLHEYDALNRPKSVKTPDNTEVLPGYNLAGLLNTVDAKLRGSSTATSFVTNIDYDEKCRRTKISYANGTDAFYEYDVLTYRLSHFRTQRGTDFLQKLNYYYDPVGNITKAKDTSTQSVYFTITPSPSPDGDYKYSALYRLIETTGREHPAFTDGQPDELEFAPFAIPHPNNPNGFRAYTDTYSYDEIGNLTQWQHCAGTGSYTRTYTYTSGTNRLATTSNATVGTRTYTHDAHGNMSLPQFTVTDWDFADQLRHIQKGSSEHIYFVYDGAGQRVRKVYEHAGLREERIYLGGYELYRKTIIATSVLDTERQTVHIADDARRVCMVETLTQTGGVPVGTPIPRYRYQLDNHLGTVCVECDASGNVISYEEYHPYGTSAYRAFQSSEVSARRYRYTGKERDEETGLYYYGARYYAP